MAALWIPGLALQCAARDDATLRERPVAITDGKVVVERNRAAVAAGVAVGMRLAEAATHAPDLLTLPDDPQAVQEVWDAALLHLDTLGPVVEDAGLGEALVDLSGAGGGERMLVRRTLHALAALLHLTARAGVADGPFVAMRAAHRAANGEVSVIPRGKSAAFLAGQLVGCLPLPATMRDELALLGVRTVAGFASLRPSDVQRRFGQIGMAALVVALGWDSRPLVPRPRERGETLTHAFEPPVDDLTPVLFVAKSLIDAHASALRREGMVAHGIALALAFEDGPPLVIEQRWGAAGIPGVVELDALRLALDVKAAEAAREGMPPRIAAVTVALRECAVDVGVQLPLTGGATILRRQAVARFLTRARALVGPEGIIEAMPVAMHLPEAGWETRPYDAARVGTPAPERPLAPDASLLPPATGLAVCIPPEPLTLDWHNGLPAALAIGQTRRDIAAALGPYTADGNWWDSGAFARAYWLLLTADQTLHLVAEERRSGAWARYAVFD